MGDTTDKKGKKTDSVRPQIQATRRNESSRDHAENWPQAEVNLFTTEAPISLAERSGLTRDLVVAASGEHTGSWTLLFQIPTRELA